MKQLLNVFSALFGLTAAILLFLYAGTNRLQVTRYEVRLDGLPVELEGLRIVHISDLHGKRFGPRNEQLARVIAGLKPDLILVSGDMLNSRGGGENAFIDLLQSLEGICPVYCALGNHEQIVRELTDRERYDDFTGRLRAAGAILLDNERAAPPGGRTGLAVYGFTAALRYYSAGSTAALPAGYLEEKLGRPSPEELTILLAHNPKYFEAYARWGADLVFSGHVHGGVVRLPFLGGLLSPDLSFFPPYDAGLYTSGTAVMHVSRGLGNSVIPFRLFNRPDVSLLVLAKA